MLGGFLWFVLVFKEYIFGKMFVKDNEIIVFFC